MFSVASKKREDHASEGRTGEEWARSKYAEKCDRAIGTNNSNWHLGEVRKVQNWLSPVVQVDGKVEGKMHSKRALLCSQPVSRDGFMPQRKPRWALGEQKELAESPRSREAFGKGSSMWHTYR